MKLKGEPVIIESGAAFAGDGLKNRKDAGDILTELVRSAEEPIVICIDAEWGQGKTTFLKMWEQDLKDNKMPVLYFNAWENDFSDNALAALIGEINIALKELINGKNDSRAKEYIAKAKNLGALLLKKAVPMALKIGTAGALDFDNITEQAISGFAETVAKEQIENYEKAKGTLVSFKASLAELAKLILEQKKAPLVFIIDELDRCRPNFAIEVLEKVKHFFNVENIVFVLGVDKTQLGHSIRAIYGQDFDVRGYLRRFIDFNYALPAPQKGDFVEVLFKRFGFNKHFAKKQPQSRNEESQALQLFTDLFLLYHLTLREQEHCCAMLNAAIRITPDNVRLFPIPLCFLIVIKTKEPDLYKNFISGKISHFELIDNLNKRDSAKILKNRNSIFMLEIYLATCRSCRDYDDVILSYRKLAQTIAGKDPVSAELKTIDAIIQRIQTLRYKDEETVPLEFLLKRLELFTSFGATDL